MSESCTDQVLLCGYPPFFGETDADVLAKAVERCNKTCFKRLLSSIFPSMKHLKFLGRCDWATSTSILQTGKTCRIPLGNCCSYLLLAPLPCYVMFPCCLFTNSSLGDIHSTGQTMQRVWFDGCWRWTRVIAIQQSTDLSARNVEFGTLYTFIYRDLLITMTRVPKRSAKPNCAGKHWTMSGSRTKLHVLNLCHWPSLIACSQGSEDALADLKLILLNKKLQTSIVKEPQFLPFHFF